MNKLSACHKQRVNKLLPSHEQVPTVVIMRLETGKTTIPGVRCMLYAVWWFPTAVRIRLSQPPAGDWLAGAWAELGKKIDFILGGTTLLAP